jgi:hypothetical protein
LTSEIGVPSKKAASQDLTAESTFIWVWRVIVFGVGELDVPLRLAAEHLQVLAVRRGDAGRLGPGGVEGAPACRRESS